MRSGGEEWEVRMQGGEERGGNWRVVGEAMRGESVVDGRLIMVHCV